MDSRILNLDDIQAMKAMLQEQFAVALHVHDTCGGQYFSMDHCSPVIQEALARFLDTKDAAAAFSADGLSFSVNRRRSC